MDSSLKSLVLKSKFGGYGRAAIQTVAAGGGIGACCALAEAYRIVGWNQEVRTSHPWWVYLAITFTYYSFYGATLAGAARVAALPFELIFRRRLSGRAWRSIWLATAATICIVAGVGLPTIRDATFFYLPAGLLIVLAIMAVAVLAAAAWLAAGVVGRRPNSRLRCVQVLVGSWAVALIVAWSIAFVHQSARWRVWTARGAEKIATSSGRPNVIFIVLDTLRADHLSCYGRQGGTSPKIDAFAARATLFENAVSASSWTLPSHASFFTGMPVAQHQLTIHHPVLSDEHVTLAEALGSDGYQTQAMSCNRLFDNSELDQGFDRWQTIAWSERSPLDDTILENLRRSIIKTLGLDPAMGILPRSENDKGARALLSAVDEWFTKEYESDRPYFLFLNYFETHWPYNPPADARREALRGELIDDSYDLDQRFDSVVYPFNAGLLDLSDLDLEIWKGLYEAEVRYLDEQVGQLLAYLEKSGRLLNTMVIVTSDHGEHLGERHWLGHWEGVYEPLVKAPLIIRFPGASPNVGRIPNVVETTDLFGTILRVCGIEFEAAAGPPWRDLALCRNPQDWSDMAISEGITRKWPTSFVGPAPVINGAGDPIHRARAVRDSQYKYVTNRPESSQMFDLLHDPRELSDISPVAPESALRMSARLKAWLSRAASLRLADRDGADPTQKNDQIFDRLRELGYLP